MQDLVFWVEDNDYFMTLLIQQLWSCK